MRLLLWVILTVGFLVAGTNRDPSALFPVRIGRYGKQTTAPSRLKVLNWNIDRGEHLAAIEAAIRRYNPDVCLLQEVDLKARRSGFLDVGDRLARTLGMNFEFGAAFEELNQAGEGNPAWQGQANLVKTAIGESRVLRFEHQTSFWEPHWYLPEWAPQRRHGGRIALVSEIPLEKSTLVLYNLHLESRGPGYNRFEQLKETLTDVDRHYPGKPAVIAGDLNTKYFAQKFVDELSKHRFVSCFGERKERTHRIIGDLDWIFVRTPAKCSSASVDRSAEGSDHYPVIAEIEAGL